MTNLLISTLYENMFACFVNERQTAVNLLLRKLHEATLENHTFFTNFLRLSNVTWSVYT